MTLYYALGTRPVPVIITIEPTESAGSRPSHRDTYTTLTLNSGRIVKITDATEKINYDWANIKIGDTLITVKQNQYFLTIAGTGLYCYYNKCAVMEDLDPETLFTGVRFKHYTNGKIRDKLCYNNGDLSCLYNYRDDLYNTLCSFTVYKHGKPQVISSYNERELLLKQQWVTEKGKTIAEKGYNNGEQGVGKMI
jgi:hypothetical protein